MDFSIYFLLSFANKNGRVKINADYRHLDFLLKKNWINRLPDGTYSSDYWELPNYGNYFVLTTEGKSQLFNFRSIVITRLISFAALIISLLGFLVSIFK